MKKKSVKIETFLGKVSGIEVDVVSENNKRMIIKSWNGDYKVLNKVNDYWEVDREYKKLSDVPIEM